MERHITARQCKFVAAAFALAVMGGGGVVLAAGFNAAALVASGVLGGSIGLAGLGLEAVTRPADRDNMQNQASPTLE